MQITIDQDAPELGLTKCSVYVPSVETFEELVDVFKQCALGVGYQPDTVAECALKNEAGEADSLIIQTLREENARLKDEAKRQQSVRELLTKELGATIKALVDQHERELRGKIVPIGTVVGYESNTDLPTLEPSAA